MIYDQTCSLLSQTPLKVWAEDLPAQIEKGFNEGRWGDLPKWRHAVEQLPVIENLSCDLDQKYITVHGDTDVHVLEEQLRVLHPWRKGPFKIAGLEIDTEWRSDLKWDRLKGHITSLKDRLCLDIGCGSGYHCWRMIGQGAKAAIGIDPTVLFVMHFLALQKYIQDPRAAVLPLGIDDLPEELPFFDTVFSMGLLYHRRSPLDHLLQLKNFLRPGGELVLETIVIDGKKGSVLNPIGRYAKMQNVWFIPSPGTLETWLKKMGFENIRLVDVTKTTSEEQRATDWMGFQSLADFLDPKDPNLTIEGYPAPQRAIFLAQIS